MTGSFVLSLISDNTKEPAIQICANEQDAALYIFHEVFALDYRVYAITAAVTFPVEFARRTLKFGRWTTGDRSRLLQMLQ
eukprot:6201461-Pleurochrysis_carterae.AAC.1